MKKDESASEALRRKLTDPAFRRQHERDELDRAAMDRKVATYRAVKQEMGAAGEGILIIHMRLGDYSHGDAAEFKFASPEQEAQFRKRVETKLQRRDVGE